MTQVQETKLIFPHEAPEQLPRPEGREWIEVAMLIGQRVPIMLRSRHAAQADKQEMTFRVINGEVGAGILPRKDQFAGFVRDLGYLAPNSIVIETGTDPEDINRLIDKSLPGEKSYFVKPVNGIGGRDTKLITDKTELINDLAHSTEDNLVQSDETPQEDWRYILHRDASDSEKIWRIAYKKIRPTVVGDGKSTVEQLVQSADNIPDDRKQKIIGKIGVKAKVVPPAALELPVATSGNITNGAYGKLPEPNELDRMDKFMARFVSDLEQQLGTKLDTQCFDLGIKDKSIFEGDYDFEKMRRSVVFYEFQIPFGISGYLDEIYTKDGRPLENIRRKLKMAGLAFKLGQSIFKNLIKVN